MSISSRVDSYLKKYNGMSESAKAAIWYTVCSVCIKGFSLLCTPIFTRIMPEADYGAFAIFQSWVSIMIIFTSLNAFMGGYSKGLLLYKGKEKEFTSASLGLTTFLTIIFIALYALFPQIWDKIFKIDHVLIPALYAELLITPAMSFWATQKRFYDKYKEYVAVTLAMSITGLLASVVCVLISSNKLYARTYSDAVVKILFSSAFFALIFYRGRKFFDKTYWKYTIQFNVPLLPHFLSMYVLNQSDRIMISRMVGDVQAAHYSVSYTIAMMMSLVVTSLNNAIMPYIYKALEAKDYQKVKRVTPVTLLMAGMCVLSMAFAPEIIFIFGGRKYMDAIYVIPPVAASVYFIFVYSMFSTIEYYYQKTSRIAAATIMSACLNIALNYYFIAKFGYLAAGYTTLVSYVFLSIMHYAFYKMIIKKELGPVKELYGHGAIVVCTAMVLLVMIIMVYTYEFWYIRYGFILLGVLICLIYRKRIQQFIGNIMRS